MLVVALITGALRQGMTDWSLWSEASQGEDGQKPQGRAIRDLLTRRHAGALTFLIVVYGVWNLVAGTYGLFCPYIVPMYEPVTADEALAADLPRGAPARNADVAARFCRSPFWGLDVVTQVELV